jgi:hypothetical protein
VSFHPGRRTATISGGFLATTAAYLVALLLGYVFGVADVERHHVETACYIFAVAAAITTLVRSQPRHSGTLPSTGRRPRLPFAVGFIAASCALYGSTAGLGLFSDDFVLIERALSRRWLAEWDFVRPLPSALWTLLLSITENPFVLHALNIVLHGVNAALVWLLARRLGLSTFSALAAGLLFLTFPSSVEAVVWPAAVHDLIVTACALGFLLLAPGEVSFARAFSASVVLIIALLSKESAIAIPALAALLWFQFTTPPRLPGWPIILGGAAMCAAYAAIRMVATAMPDSYAQGPSRYLAKELLARSLGTLGLPWSRSVLESQPAIGYVWSVGFVIVAAAYAWRTTHHVQPSVIAKCLAAVVIGVIPVYSLFFITPDLGNARYVYLSTVFWVIVLAGLLDARDEDWSRLSRPLVVGAAIVLGAIGVQWHVAGWREAAELRERVLTAAQSLVEQAPCPMLSLAGAPDSVEGAYVFRNGLGEATARRTSIDLTNDPADCVFEWDGTSFQRTSNPSTPIQATVVRPQPLPAAGSR